MPDEKIGVVIKYFGKIGVAAITLTDGPLKVGDILHITGHTTDLHFTVDSIQVEHESVPDAAQGTDVGIKVPDKVRDHDQVFRVIDEEGSVSV